MNKTRLLVVEETRLIRDGIVAMLNKQRDFKVLGASGVLEDIILEARRSNPHIVLVNLNVRHQNSLQILDMLKKNIPGTQVVVVGLAPQEQNVVNFVKAGASGFILREATPDAFMKTIRFVAKGVKVLPRELTDSFFSQIVGDRFQNGKIQPPNVQLTKREQQVVALIGEGLSNKEIAQRIHLATNTVKSHVHNLLKKLSLRTRLQIATVFARGTN